ncbi:MAG: CvpA family protein [Janthinobacterium lividum]
MNWVDLVVLAVVLVSGLVGVLRGLVREVLGVAAWIAAAWVASPYGAFPYVAPWVRKQVSDPGVGDIVAFGGVFLVALVVLWIVVGAISNRVRGSALGGLDRTFGLVFGLGRGAVLLAAAYILGGFLSPSESWPPPVQQARLLTPVYQGAEWLASQVPPPYRPNVAKPPAGRTTTAAALLHATPAGRALSARPARE